MSWLIAIVSTVIFVEAFLRLPLIPKCKSMGGLAAKILRMLSSNHISDHWKEIALRQYALLLGGHSLALFMWLLLCVIPGMLIAVLGEALGAPVYATLTSVTGIAVCTLAGTLYALGRSRMRDAHGGQ